MKIVDLSYLDILVPENEIQGGALIPGTLYSEKLTASLAKLSQKSTTSLGSNPIGSISFESLFSSLTANLGSGGSVSRTVNIDRPSSRGIVINVQAPMPQNGS